MDKIANRIMFQAESFDAWTQQALEPQTGVMMQVISTLLQFVSSKTSQSVSFHGLVQNFQE